MKHLEDVYSDRQATQNETSSTLNSLYTAAAGAADRAREKWQSELESTGARLREAPQFLERMGAFDGRAGEAATASEDGAMCQQHPSFVRELSGPTGDEQGQLHSKGAAVPVSESSDGLPAAAAASNPEVYVAPSEEPPPLAARSNQRRQHCPQKGLSETEVADSARASEEWNPGSAAVQPNNMSVIDTTTLDAAAQAAAATAEASMAMALQTTADMFAEQFETRLSELVGPICEEKVAFVVATAKVKVEEQVRRQLEESLRAAEARFAEASSTIVAQAEARLARGALEDVMNERVGKIMTMQRDIGAMLETQRLETARSAEIVQVAARKAAQERVDAFSKHHAGTHEEHRRSLFDALSLLASRTDQLEAVGRRVGSTLARVQGELSVVCRDADEQRNSAKKTSAALERLAARLDQESRQRAADVASMARAIEEALADSSASRPCSPSQVGSPSITSGGAPPLRLGGANATDDARGNEASPPAAGVPVPPPLHPSFAGGSSSSGAGSTPPVVPRLRGPHSAAVAAADGSPSLSTSNTPALSQSWSAPTLPSPREGDRLVGSASQPRLSGVSGVSRRLATDEEMRAQMEARRQMLESKPSRVLGVRCAGLVSAGAAGSPRSLGQQPVQSSPSECKQFHTEQVAENRLDIRRPEDEAGASGSALSRGIEVVVNGSVPESGQENADILPAAPSQHVEAPSATPAHSQGQLGDRVRGVLASGARDGTLRQSLRDHQSPTEAGVRDSEAISPTTRLASYSRWNVTTPARRPEVDGGTVATAAVNFIIGSSDDMATSAVVTAGLPPTDETLMSPDDKPIVTALVGTSDSVSAKVKELMQGTRDGESEEDRYRRQLSGIVTHAFAGTRPQVEFEALGRKRSKPIPRQNDESDDVALAVYAQAAPRIWQLRTKIVCKALGMPGVADEVEWAPRSLTEARSGLVRRALGKPVVASQASSSDRRPRLVTVSSTSRPLVCTEELRVWQLRLKLIRAALGVPALTGPVEWFKPIRPRSIAEARVALVQHSLGNNRNSFLEPFRRVASPHSSSIEAGDVVALSVSSLSSKALVDLVRCAMTGHPEIKPSDVFAEAELKADASVPQEQALPIAPDPKAGRDTDNEPSSQAIAQVLAQGSTQTRSHHQFSGDGVDSTAASRTSNKLDERVNMTEEFLRRIDTLQGEHARMEPIEGLGRHGVELSIAAASDPILGRHDTLSG